MKVYAKKIQGGSPEGHFQNGTKKSKLGYQQTNKMTMKYKGSSRVRKHKHTHTKKESINTKEKLVTVTKVLKNF